MQSENQREARIKLRSPALSYTGRVAMKKTKAGGRRETKRSEADRESGVTEERQKQFRRGGGHQ